MKKFYFSTLLLLVYCSPLWGQLNIVGVNTEKPNSITADFLNKPIVVDSLLPKYDIRGELPLLFCAPNGQRFYSSGLEEDDGVFSQDGDTIKCGLPAGYYNYVGVLLYREQVDTLIRAIAMQWDDMKTVSGSPRPRRGIYEYRPNSNDFYRLSILKEGLSINRIKRLGYNDYWGILEDDTGKQYYIIPSVAGHGLKGSGILEIKYYEEIVSLLKNKDVAICYDGEYDRDLIYKNHAYRDYWTGTPVPVDILNIDKLTFDNYNTIEYYSVRDIVINLEEKNKEIQIIAVLDDNKGNTFSVKIPRYKAIGRFYSGSDINIAPEIMEINDRIRGTGYVYLISKDLLFSYVSYQNKNEQERKALKNQEIQKKKQAEQTYKSSIIQKYGEKTGTLILNHKLALGMTPEMCKESIGYPSRSIKKTTVLGENLIYEYAYMVLTFSNDRLTSVTEVK